MRLIIAGAVLAAGLCVSTANAQSFGVTNIGSLPGNANRYYGEARGWEVAAGYDRGYFEYCYAARDRDGNGDDIRIGYGSGQWQIAVPVDSRPDWYGQLDIDGRTIGASGTAAQGWTYAWIGLPELDALRGGSHAVLRIGPYDIDFSLSGVTAATLLVQECVDREGRGGGRRQPPPSANYTPPPPSAGLGWADQSGGAIDREAMPVGHEANGETLYACTAAFNDGNHPGKLRPAFGGCVIGYGGREYTVRQYSTLLGQGRWIATSSQYQLPEGAYDGGNEANDSPLYLCRAPFNGGLHPGKVGPSTGGCNVTYGGVEHTIYQFEVLVP